ncbi:hypothetical protein CORC01_00902 [Colletotrichum orchidophilum]|uniref:Uncharacterized protein n=1 Tax=Colletotrichum orchidophilum TaxID=1209926 RepID=A0A1G4BRN5_9PEZI|nr:uncharacterized protein CORC01_00902 [Colletotrichum orchidophilum]OHF04040.1 hypothetical protein CORC01_00902 [Colletotrichum orchidophilum]
MVFTCGSQGQHTESRIPELVPSSTFLAVVGLHPPRFAAHEQVGDAPDSEIHETATTTSATTTITTSSREKEEKEADQDDSVAAVAEGSVQATTAKASSIHLLTSDIQSDISSPVLHGTRH